MTLVFRRWTALCLALEGQWAAGPTQLQRRRSDPHEDTLEWFHNHRGAAHAGRVGQQVLSSAVPFLKQ